MSRREMTLMWSAFCVATVLTALAVHAGELHRSGDHFLRVASSVISIEAVIALATMLFAVIRRSLTLRNGGTELYIISDKHRPLFIASTIISIVLGLLTIAGYYAFHNPGGLQLSPVFAVTALTICIQAFPRDSLTETGLKSRYGNIPWQQIASYGWENDNTLVLGCPSRLLRCRLNRQFRYAIAPEQKNGIDSLLADRIGRNR